MWVKLDDHFFQHPKILQATPAAKLLYLAGLTWCAANLTDGLIPAAALPVLAAEAGIDPSGAGQIAEQLLELGLWVASDSTAGDYRVHHFLEYNPSRVRVLATRQARSDAGRKGGRASRNPRNPSPDPGDGPPKGPLSPEPSEAQAEPEHIASPVPRRHESEIEPRTRTRTRPLREPPSAKASGGPRPPEARAAQSCPVAVDAFRSAANLNPRRETWPLFEEKLGADPDQEALSALRRAVTLWISAGYNRANVAGVLDWTLELLAGRDPTRRPRSGVVPGEPAGFRALRAAGLDIPSLAGALVTEPASGNGNGRESPRFAVLGGVADRFEADS